MDKAIIAKKIGMSQVFTKEGKVIPVTVLEAGPCPVVQIKTKENDGYDAIQVGFGYVKARCRPLQEGGRDSQKVFARAEIGKLRKLQAWAGTDLRHLRRGRQS